MAASKPSFVSIANLFARTLLAALKRAATSPFSSRRAPSYLQDVAYAAFRTLLALKTIALARYLDPTTTDRYLALCKSKGDAAKTVHVKYAQGSVAAHWIGSPSADVVVLYLHGGGYTLASVPGHTEYLHRLVKDFNGPGRKRSLAVLFVAYSLAPEATHPTQLKEAAAVLSYLLDKCGKSPSNIFVSGDSAGGGLSLTLLCHLLHPHPAVAEVTLSEPLLGAFVYSPWVSFKTTHDSYKRNATTDVLPPKALRCWALMYTGRTEANPEKDPGYDPKGDSYTEPASNDSKWWSGLQHVVGDVLIWAGGNEVFVDGIRAFKAALQEGWTAGGGDVDRVRYIESPKEAHIQPMTDNIMKPGVKGEAQIAIEAWLNVRLDS